jgi:serine/threonine protein kinase
VTLESGNGGAREPKQASGEGVLAEGSRFGVYVVGPCIGHGAMARIYRAEHEGLRRSVALKVLHEWAIQVAEGHQRFLREARIAAAIKHPNVVNIFDVGVQDSVPYLVMELLEGEDLEAMMRAHGALSEGALVDIVLPIAAGLAAVHDAGVVHRDLKPGNIFLARGRNDEIEPKLLDFGISRAAESEQLKLTMAQGLLMGTPRYMSPEGIRRGEITALSDQYSLGVVVYECLTGENPFFSDALAETLHRVTSGEYCRPSQHPKISKRMARILERAMSLDPSERFADLREMGRELLLLAGQRARIAWGLSFGEGTAKRAPFALDALRERPAPLEPSVLGRHRKVPVRSSALFGLLLICSALTLYWIFRQRDPPLLAKATRSGGNSESRLDKPERASAERAEPEDQPSGERPAAPNSKVFSLATKADPQPSLDAAGRAPLAENGDAKPKAPAERRALPAAPKARPARARKRSTPVVPQLARPTRELGDEQQQPDWLGIIGSGGAASGTADGHDSAARGTNDAPIFE